MVASSHDASPDLNSRVRKTAPTGDLPRPSTAWGGFLPGGNQFRGARSLPRTAYVVARLRLHVWSFDPYRYWKLSGVILEISSEPHEMSRQLHFQQRRSCQTRMEPVRHVNLLRVVLRNNRTLIPFRSTCTLSYMSLAARRSVHRRIAEFEKCLRVPPPERSLMLPGGTDVRFAAKG
jgi:hypothetical protein